MQKAIKLFGISNEKIKMHYIIIDILSIIDKFITLNQHEIMISNYTRSEKP